MTLQGQAAMIAVCDMGPLHYLVLIEAEYVLPRIFDRVLTPPAVVAEMGHPNTPEPVGSWSTNPPRWLEVRAPTKVEDIPTLGRKGGRGDADRAVIALALKEQADFVVLDDMKARREAKKRGLAPLWMLQVLDEAAERGLIDDLAEKLDHLRDRTRFYVGEKARSVIEAMNLRDVRRKLAQDPPGRTPE